MIYKRVQGDKQLQIKTIYNMRERLSANVSDDKFQSQQFILGGYSGIQIIDIQHDFNNKDKDGGSFCIQATSKIFFASKNISQFIEFQESQLLVIFSDDPQSVYHLDLLSGCIIHQLQKDKDPFLMNFTNEFFFISD